MTVGNHINIKERRKYRKLAGLTQMELANKAGFSQRTIFAWETGETLTDETAKRIDAAVIKEIKQTTKRLISLQLGA